MLLKCYFGCNLFLDSWGKIAITNPKFSPLKIKAVASFHLDPDFCINLSFYVKPISMDLVPWKGSFFYHFKSFNFWISYFRVWLFYKNSFVILFGDINERLYADDVLQLLECILWHLLENESLKTRSSLTWKLQRKMAILSFTLVWAKDNVICNSTSRRKLI